MTHGERLLATLRFQPVDRVPDFEFGAWEQTIMRWYREACCPETHLAPRMLVEPLSWYSLPSCIPLR